MSLQARTDESESPEDIHSLSASQRRQNITPTIGTATMSFPAPRNASERNGTAFKPMNGSLNLPLPRSHPDKPSPQDGARREDSSTPKLPPSFRNSLEWRALNDTPATTAPNSPSILPVVRQNSGEKHRARPTTLDIPGLTKSAVSPDGRISERDVGSKLVIVMVGLPARGKSYITKKMARYLNWLQHDTRIFNVGERRRVAASGSKPPSALSPTLPPAALATPAEIQINGIPTSPGALDPVARAADILANDMNKESTDGLNAPVPTLCLPGPEQSNDMGVMDQSASFFDPDNRKAAMIREQVASETLDELLDYIMHQGGSVGILDATNSTLERRKNVMKQIRNRCPDLNVLFLESVCLDENLLARNMRLKLSGPDYQGKDPTSSLEDFKKRVEIYKKKYVPLGEYEERNNMPYVQMIDVGRKIISHQIKGFLSGQAVYYLLNFNLAPRQIWITRHGQSEDNRSGKLGGDSSLTEEGRKFAQALPKFLSAQRKDWEVHELDKRHQYHMSPFSGDTTPPNPHYPPDGDEDHIVNKNFCVWTSMLKRSVETAQYFDENDFDIKQMRMLNELNAGDFEGWTYEEIKNKARDQYDERSKNRLQYRYPGPGGEGYLDVINRLRPVIVELERMTDHVLLIGHRSVARILLAYFKGLPRHDVTDLDVPVGMVFCMEPKPYGVDIKAFRYDPRRDEFKPVPDFELQRITSAGEEAGAVG